MEKYWIDSHAHIAYGELFESWDEIVANARDLNVQLINIICGSLEEMKQALSKIEGNPQFHISLGVHPTELDNYKDIKTFESFLTHPQVVCVGEIGIDMYWDQTQVQKQIEILVAQINLANQYQLPIAVHVRNEKDGSTAIDTVIDVLKKHPVDNKGVIHCYSDTVENAKILLDMGYYLGFGGITTFKNGGNVRDVLDIIPLDRILTETDSPYLAPMPKRGKRNEPAYVSYTGEYIANHLDMSVEALQEQVMKNYKIMYKKI